MKLKDWIDEHPTEFVYIGAYSGFFYCGIAKDCRGGCRKFNEYNLTRAKRLIKTYGDELIASIRNIPKYEQDIEYLKKKLYKGSRYNVVLDEISGLEKKVAFCKNVEETYPDKIREQSLYIKNFVEAIEREIVDVYETNFKKPSGYNIIVEGQEIGFCWDNEEYTSNQVHDEDEEYGY